TDPPPIIVVIDDQYRAIRHERIAPVESAGAPWNTRAPDSSMSMRWRRRWTDQASDLRLQRGGTEWSGQDAGAAGTQQLGGMDIRVDHADDRCIADAAVLDHLPQEPDARRVEAVQRDQDEVRLEPRGDGRQRIRQRGHVPVVLEHRAPDE